LPSSRAAAAKLPLRAMVSIITRASGVRARLRSGIGGKGFGNASSYLNEGFKAW
jgi:hypothetical protein